MNSTFVIDGYPTYSISSIFTENGDTIIQSRTGIVCPNKFDMMIVQRANTKKSTEDTKTMSEIIFITIRGAFYLTAICFIAWILIISDILPWPDASNGAPLITKILSIVTLASFASCPIAIIIKEVSERKLYIGTIISIVTLLTYIPFLIKRRTFKSEICT